MSTMLPGSNVTGSQAYMVTAHRLAVYTRGVVWPESTADSFNNLPSYGGDSLRSDPIVNGGGRYRLDLEYLW